MRLLGFDLYDFVCAGTVTTMASEAEIRKDREEREIVFSRLRKAITLWEEEQVFKAESRKDSPKPGEKFFSTFPFPYMNGYLHIGHAFSLSKIDFASAYHRLRGANVLLPFGFHCTGMPIKASADKLAREMHDMETLLISAETTTPTSSRNPYEWLYYFPPLAVEDLKAYGLGCDWRRSFVTTDVNPFFDAFVRWQMRKLKSMGKIVKDRRYTIFSPLDGQPCADHDRATGEATLRPETMYGQTNAWVLPDGKYGAYEINETDVFILTERDDLIGLPLRSPLAVNEIIYALPMLTILTNKGTGIVTSVPSDAPDDYMALHDLSAKPALRAKFGVKDEWVPSEIVPIINIPSLEIRLPRRSAWI
ncbi:unnamed protein product [Microthlaspi erraticum]|uniref:leucine--tRNA ligase n=1 Tax=Microthlaspi erraticum TaxID=1685480 RepID=A0A6D2IC09_9BRAS|nr:unnamed protein product [Microthlaspi erraticum]